MLTGSHKAFVFYLSEEVHSIHVAMELTESKTECIEESIAKSAATSWWVTGGKKQGTRHMLHSCLPTQICHVEEGTIS